MATLGNLNQSEAAATDQCILQYRFPLSEYKSQQGGFLCPFFLLSEQKEKCISRLMHSLPTVECEFPSEKFAPLKSDYL